MTKPHRYKRKTDAVVFSSETDPISQFNGLDTGLYKANDNTFLKCTNCSEYDAILIFQLTLNENPTPKRSSCRLEVITWRFKVQKNTPTIIL